MEKYDVIVFIETQLMILEQQQNNRYNIQKTQ